MIGLYYKTNPVKSGAKCAKGLEQEQSTAEENVWGEMAPVEYENWPLFAPPTPPPRSGFPKTGPNLDTIGD